MFGLGSCMCHCGATLWKIDATTGEIIWSSDRGADSNCLDVVSVEGLVTIPEGGSPNTDDETIRLVTDAGSPAQQWSRATGSEVLGTVYSVGDDRVWSSATNDLERIDASDGSPNGSLVQPASIHPFDGNAGDVFAHMTTVFRRFGDTPSQLNSAASSSALPIGKNFSNDILYMGGSFNRTIFRVDSGFNLVDSAVVATFNGRIISENGTKCAISDAGGILRKIDIASLSADWSVSPGGAIGESAIDSLGNVYTRSGNTVRRHASVDGATDWTLALDSFSQGHSARIEGDDDLLYIWGKVGYDGKERGIVAVNTADGSVAWTISGGGSADRVNMGQLHDGFLYVVSDRMSLSLDE